MATNDARTDNTDITALDSKSPGCGRFHDKRIPARKLQSIWREPDPTSAPNHLNLWTEFVGQELNHSVPLVAEAKSGRRPRDERGSRNKRPPR